jgi:DNA replication and repair protein RecF
MTLLQLDVEQFRCIERARLELHPQVNLIVGQNASGKTSLLEAIFLLGTGRSFRTHQTELLIRTGTDQFLAVGKINGRQGAEILGIRGAQDIKEIRINGSAAGSLADLALRLPVQIIDPEVHRLVEDGPVRRRRFMDWGVFHVEHQFHDTWRRYQRALRQRNAGLKAKQAATALRVWDQELAEQGTRVADFRDEYIAALKPFVRDLGQELLGLEIELEHQRGWRRQAELATVLADSLQRDLQRGMTAAGPHRADLLLKIQNLQAKDHVSRGQQKMLACVLILAQQLHRVTTGAPPACLLLDDPAAELDVDNLRKLLAAIARVPAQLVVTALTNNLLEFFPPARVFHVEHGFVQAVA